jgi:hypothetical protein
MSMWGLEVKGPGARFSGGSASESAGGALVDAIPVVSRLYCALWTAAPRFDRHGAGMSFSSVGRWRSSNNVNCLKDRMNSGKSKCYMCGNEEKNETDYMHMKVQKCADKCQAYYKGACQNRPTVSARSARDSQGEDLTRR